MTPAAPPKPPEKSLRQLLLARHQPELRKLLFFSIVTNLLSLAPTWFMLETYDRVVNSRNETTLVMLLIMVIGAYVLMEALEIVRGATLGRIAMALDESLRKRLFDTAFQMTLRAGPGANATQCFVDLKTVREFIPSASVTAMLDAPAAIIFVIFVFVISPWLGVLAAVGAIIQTLIAIRTEKRTMPVLTDANRAAIQAQGYATNALRNVQVIEAMGMMRNVLGRWMMMQRRFLKLQADASDHAGVNNAVSRFIQTAQSSLILGASCWLSLNGQMLGGGGMMIVASTIGGRALTPLAQLVASWRSVVNVRDAIARLDRILAQFPESEPTMPLPPPKGNLAVEQIIGGAPGNPSAILRGINFALKPGEVLVVLGPSASGKTTLARMLTGIWQCTAGKVRLDGADVYAWNKEELGPYIGYLPQTVELFDGTLAENIARFGEVDEAKVRAAATLIGLDPMIDALDDGLQTRIGEDGQFLSGGQRQRVGIARAVYGMPRLLVLDEPNSSLDDAGEQAFSNTLVQLKAAGCTCIVMSHRTSVLAQADKILMLRDGAQVIFGPRDEVLAKLQQAAQQQAQAQAQAQARLAQAKTGPVPGAVVPGGAA